MSATSRYTKPPITEAILDIQVENSGEPSPLALESCQHPVRATYPTKRELRAAVAHIDLGSEPSASATARDVGFAFISPDGKQLFQVRTNGFTANRLAPYSRWEEFSSEAKKLWTIYRERTKPNRITRVALRYINRIDLPGESIELKDYFQTSPDIARGLPQSMSGFFMHVVLPLGDVKSAVNIIETIVEPPRPGIVSVVLDLDFFRTDEIPETEEGLWALFEELRVKKNVVFEACLTDKTKELLN
jgi:uncharacterized protein (TIGR04255 family)